jgi:2,4-dienoyl-CoA reductase-like NADH-dependent reductase (Old Yellow Enzyme family)/thioredoxin reductase
MFASLFRPGNIGKLNLNNRLIMAAMGNALADENGFVTEAMLEYYRARARGGVGMVITQFVSITPGDAIPYNLRLHDDIFIPGMSNLVDQIHRQGAKVCIQLMHPGMLLLMLKSIPDHQKILVPSLMPLLPKERHYQELSSTDIENCVQDFILAAKRAKECGADAIELHACHGCLLSTFLSPAVNRRTDLYGGSTEKRARLVERIVVGIKATAGREFPLIVRINGDDGISGGVSPDEVLRYVDILGGAGADAISISSGIEYWSTLMAPSYLTGQGVIIPIAQEVKKRTHLPVIVAGKITPALAERTIGSGKADFVALGRPLLADPELPNKLSQGRLDDINLCLYCNNCMRTSWRSCTVNPFLYREATTSLMCTSVPKKVMVIGGGLAGMQAAVLCSMRGHEVSLFEKDSALGGQWKVACSLPGKGPYASLTNSLKRAMVKYQVKVVLGFEMTREQILANKPDIAILATGAFQIRPVIPGISALNVIQANDVTEGKSEATGKTIIFGSSVLAMEVTILLAAAGKEVILVSAGGLGGRKGPDDMITFSGLMKLLIQYRVPLYLNSVILEASNKELAVRWGEQMLSLPCDTLVAAAGVQARDTLSNELKGIVPEVYLIGDCVVPGNAAQATFSAARLALKL